MAVTRGDLTKALAAGGDGKVSLAVVGCVWYRAVFEGERTQLHQTRFAYMLGIPIGPTEGTVASLNSGIPIGVQSLLEPKGSPQGVQLVPEPFGNSAD